MRRVVAPASLCCACAAVATCVLTSCGSFGTDDGPPGAEAGATDGVAASDAAAEAGTGDAGCGAAAFIDDFERTGAPKDTWDNEVTNGGGKLLLDKTSLVDGTGSLKIELQNSGSPREAHLVKNLAPEVCVTRVAFSLRALNPLPPVSFVSVRFSGTEVELGVDGDANLVFHEAGSTPVVLASKPSAPSARVTLEVRPLERTASVAIDLPGQPGAIGGVFNLSMSKPALVRQDVRIGALDATAGGAVDYAVDTVRIE